MYRDTAILPTSTKMNPASPATAEFFDEGQTAYVMQKVGAKRPTRVFTSFGEPFADWAVGSHQTVRHDQTCGYMGEFVVVGVVNFKSGVSWGDIPNKKLAHGVFK